MRWLRYAVRAFSLYHKIGMSDMTTDDVYFERGISHLHGFLTEYYVDDAQYIVKIPQGLKRVAVLMEPLTVAEKGIAQAYEIQRRLRVWRPQRAAVMGAGSIGLLVTLALRLRGVEVTTFSLARKPNLNADLVEVLGARYISTQDVPVLAGAQQFGPFDLIFEATGYSQWPSTACRFWERTASWCFPASPVAIDELRFRLTRSILNSCSAIE